MGIARKFGGAVDLMTFELKNAKIHALSSDPSLVSGDEALIWYNTTSHRLKYWTGSAAELKATDSDLLGGNNGAYYLARGNHSGSQTAATISDFNAAVRANTLDQLTAAAADVNANSNRVINLLDPSSNQDAATKAYVDAAIASLTSGTAPKGSVRAAVSTNVNLASPGTTLDGLTATTTELYWLYGQTNTTQNGPYVYNGSGSAMTRATNWDSNDEAVLGSYWVVREGTKADQIAILTNDTAITLGTSTPAVTFISAAGAAYVGGAGLTLTGQTFDVGQGTGITVNANDVAIDVSVVLRYVKGVIPTSTSGIYTVSGAAVTINHGLNNLAARPHVVYYTSPGSGNTAGDPLECQYNNPDANNTVITFPANPATNQYYVMISG